MTTRGFQEVSAQFKKNGCPVTLPLKATRNSAGYDFITPIDLDIPPQSKVKFYTDVKAYMQPDEVLLLFPRSSTGCKWDLEIANQTGIIDSDFADNPDNDGNIQVILWNRRPRFDWDGDEEFDFVSASGEILRIPIPFITDLTEENTVHIKAGDRVVQGIFFKPLPADDGNSDAQRISGIGSTGK